MDILHTRPFSKVVGLVHICAAVCRDAVHLQHSYEIYSQHVELSVHDNVLLVHHLDSSTVLLLDVRARSNGPIAGPLPLAMISNEQASQCQMWFRTLCLNLQA